MPDFDIDMGGYTRCGPAWNSNSWAYETCHKLYVIGGGSGRYAIPGHELELRPERLVLIPGGRRHRYGPAKDMQVHWLHVHVLSPAIERRLARLDRILDWPLADWRWWRPAWESIPAWLDVRDLPGELRLHAFVTAVLAEAFTGSEPGPTLDPRLEPALRWMDAHCLEHPPLAAAARIAGFAPAVFHRRFAAEFSCTPRAWLEARRLDHARRLLREPGATVQSVAAICGYTNPFHFARVVRRRLGVSPSELKRLRGP